MKLGEFKARAREGVVIPMRSKRRVRWEEWDPAAEGLKMDEMAPAATKKAADDIDLSHLFDLVPECRKRKAKFVRPDIPSMDVRTLARLPSEIADKMEKSRAKLREK
jgi:hypothetical protein